MIIQLIPTYDLLTGGPVAACHNLEKALEDHGLKNSTLVLCEHTSLSILRYLLRRDSVVVAHSIWNIWTIIAALFTPLRGKRVLVFSHGMLSREAFRTGASFKKWLFARIFMFIFRTFGTRILFATHSERDNSYFKNLKSAIVPNIVDTTIRERNVLGEKHLLQVRIAYASRFSPRKGLLALVKAFNCLDNNRIRLDIVGLKDDEEYERQVRKECIGISNIYFHDGLSGKAAQKIVTECHAVVLFSEFEGLPMSLLEALAMGKFVVCTSHCNLPNLREEQAGIIANTFDELKDALKKLSNLTGQDVIAQEKLAHNYIHRYFSSSQIVDRLIKSSS